MDSKGSVKKQIQRTKSLTECKAIQQDLALLLKSATKKVGALTEKETEYGLNFKGHGATSCSQCSNTFDPRGNFGITCEGCDEDVCKECYDVCNACDAIRCNDCMRSCVSCEERFCCSMQECWRCNEEVCNDCVVLVGPPEWECCVECRDDYVSGGWNRRW